MAHSNPNVAAICIHSFRFSGMRIVMMPESIKGTPRKLGKYDVRESESERIEMATPHRRRNVP
jgi:hypothetical protein